MGNVLWAVGTVIALVLIFALLFSVKPHPYEIVILYYLLLHSYKAEDND